LARREGFEHVVYGGSFGTEHAWDNPDWRVLVVLDAESAELNVEKRWRGMPRMWNTRIATLTVTSCAQIYGVLTALGVLPSPEERAA
jgi:hypothetical protein